MTEISSVINSKEQHIYHVYFENGAKTKIHTHNGSQILIVTKGRGILETFSKIGSKADHFGVKRTQRVRLNLGDVVYIPKGTLHTHGSVDKKKIFSHMAINIIPSRNTEYKTTWYESDFKKAVSTIIK